MRAYTLLAAASLPAIAIFAAAPAIAGEVTGSVVDASQTMALRAADVRIAELGRVATTDADGSFYLAEIPAGTYTLEVRYVGAETVRREVRVPASGEVRLTVVVGKEENAQILVVGQAANQASALSRKRASDTVGDVVTRDAIGQFPDQNVAESLRRLPGINVLNDQGEGRFVSIRGLDPELNSTSLNGVRLPAPESDVRSVALDVISSDIIESIEVKKSLTPDMDADTIGGSVEIETTSAFARKKRLLTARVEGSYNEFSDKLTPKGSIDFASRLTDDVGITGGLSYYKRKFETDNIEADDWSETANGPFPATVEYRDYDVTRKRLSATLGLDARAGDTTELYLKGTFSQFDDQEYRRRTEFDLGDFEDDGPSSYDGTNATFSDADEAITVKRDIKDRFERQRIWSVVAGGETHANGWNVEYLASYSRASERENGSIDPAKFEHEFDDEGLVLGFDYSDPRKPLYSVLANGAGLADASAYELDDIEYTALSDSRDEEWSTKIDLGREFATARGTFTVQAGFKGRWRDKSYNKEVEFYENGDLTLADVLGKQTYRIGDISPVASYRGVRDAFLAHRDDYELQEVDTRFDSNAEDYAVSEDIMAGYLLGRFESDDLRVIGGVRYEHTSNDIRGNLVTLVEEDGTLPDGSTATEDTVLVGPVAFDRDYGDWMPSLNLRYEASSEVILRAAVYRSLVRPKLSKLAPRFVVEESDDGEREGESGNPALKPYKAWNFDASAEWYFGRNAALTGAVFYKDIKNYIVDTVREDGSFNGIAFTEASVPINGPSADIWGVEIGFSQAFTMLPAPFDGLLVQANYTYTDASGTVPTDGDIGALRDIPLPATSKHTGNVTLGYEKGPVSLRLAGTYRDKYLDELGDEAAADRYVDDHFQLDFTAKYRVNQLVQLYYEWVNINDAKYFAYNTLGGRQNLQQYERYNWTMKFGARLTF